MTVIYRIHKACEKSSFRSSLAFLEGSIHGFYTFIVEICAMVVEWGAFCIFLKGNLNLM